MEGSALAKLRSCAASALNKVYHYYGLTQPQQDIWKVISQPDAHGGRYAMTYRLSFDARQRGLHVVAIKAKDPILAGRQLLKKIYP